jgi:hypothetical protein
MILPGTAIDRAAFATVIRGFSNPPFFISGNGSQTNPWKLRTFTPQGRTESHKTPVIVSLGDDSEGFFQSSPPSPIDLAVIFNNFQRLGAKKAASAAVLAWDAPDPIGLMALDKAINRFDVLIMTAPLSRGAVPEPIPPAFRKASLSLDFIHGDASGLPIVNRIPLPGIILGRGNTLAGFQTLDSEPVTGFTPLMARWEDRIVFAFPLLIALQQLNLPLDGLEIRIGEYIKLSPDGPVVPIDRYGRLAVPVKSASPHVKIPAESLIDGGEGLIPKQAPEPIILRDDRSASEPSTREFSRNLPAIIAAISSDTALAPARAYPRLSTGRELVLLSVLVIALSAIGGLPQFARNITFLSTAAICIAIQCIAAGTSELWLPGLPALAAVLGAVLLSLGSMPSPAFQEAIAVRPSSETPILPPNPPLAVSEVSQIPENPSARIRRKRGKKRRH